MFRGRLQPARIVAVHRVHLLERAQQALGIFRAPAMDDVDVERRHGRTGENASGHPDDDELDLAIDEQLEDLSEACALH